MARRPRSQSESRSSRMMGDSWADQEEALFGFATSRPDEGPKRPSSSNGRSAKASTTNNNGGTRGSNGWMGAGRSTSNSGNGTGTGTWRDSAGSAGRTMQRGIEGVRRRMEAYPGTTTTHTPAAHDGSLWPWEEEGRAAAGGRGDTQGNLSSRSGGDVINRSPGPSSTSSTGATPGSSSVLPDLSALSSLSRRVTSALVNHANVPQCVVCGTLAPSRYQYHPFFPEEIACSSHSDAGRCSSCNRFEPMPGSTFGGNHFADLGDRGRKLCPSCLRTVVTDSDEGRQLWFDVLRYLDSEHGLLSGGVRSSMEGIPVLVVEHNALNDPGVRGSGHHDHDHGSGRGHGGGAGSSGGHTRGLCVYEYTTHPLGGQLRSFLRSAGVSDVRGIIGDVLGTTKNTRVTAVLCLRGLPRDLAASVLAHEATHAWFKLHRSYDPHHGGGLPLVVEEGCCQLVAHLYLRHLEERGDADSGPGDGHGPSDKRLRQYFRYSIETMTDEVYGEGFRLAAAAYAACGASSGTTSSLRSLLDYVAENGSFPPA